MKINEVFILEERGVLYINGEDKDTFLQNLISNDIKKVSETNSCFASLLTPQGKYLFEFIIVKHKNGYFFECEKKIIDGHLNVNDTDTSGTYSALKLAEESDYVITVLGEHGFQSGEGRSRSKIKLPGLQEQFLKEIYKVNKNIILVVMTGRPLDLSWAGKNLPAIVVSWHLGTMSGEAISSILYGDSNPSGKLPMSFPRSVGQIPVYYNPKSTGRPGPSESVFWSHFSDEKNDPLYPFGYGLSYTDFLYSKLNINKIGTKSIEVNFNVKNIGNRIGKEIIQLYIKDLYSSYTRPIKELKRFKKLSEKTNLDKLKTDQKIKCKYIKPYI